MKKIQDEAEIWADGYSFVEFQRTGTGLIPYHHEFRSSTPAPPVASPLRLAQGESESGWTPWVFLA
ncbi:hypothetical protein CH92_09925 [Stutzerimonas stutzeri]|uniref:Uncharacterized protein n=1 Tax=Stutzerimonas stutzeri TaxID=316 RepID=W8R4S1_STUST|nr:hypothetical protein [Stutzerimonas stutzeri]AHL77634.1 hypothetical protein CH92_09925 [Stutzerimonas stutzeri]MCQ4328029.1 hypothetical protein [Stutzerimonas stutzeri]